MSKTIIREWTEGVLVIKILGYDLNDIKEYQAAGMKLIYSDRRCIMFVKSFDK